MFAVCKVMDRCVNRPSFCTAADSVERIEEFRDGNENFSVTDPAPDYLSLKPNEVPFDGTKKSTYIYVSFVLAPDLPTRS